MKIVLTQQELAEAVRAHYPAMQGYRVADVKVSKYSDDYCTIECEPVEKPVEIKPVEAA